MVQVFWAGTITVITRKEPGRKCPRFFGIPKTLDHPQLWWLVIVFCDAVSDCDVSWSITFNMFQAFLCNPKFSSLMLSSRSSHGPCQLPNLHRICKKNTAKERGAGLHLQKMETQKMNQLVDHFPITVMFLARWWYPIDILRSDEYQRALNKSQVRSHRPPVKHQVSSPARDWVPSPSWQSWWRGPALVATWVSYLLTAGR